MIARSEKDAVVMNDSEKLTELLLPTLLFVQKSPTTYWQQVILRL